MRHERTRMAIYELDGERPELPADDLYWVAETASVIGRVRLHSEVSIWYGSVLRGDNEWIDIGARSQIQDNCTLHTDPGFPLTIGQDCVIAVSYTHLRAHETKANLVCRLLLEKK